MFEIVLFGGAFLVGLFVGRWWAVVLAIPVAVGIAYSVPLENVDPPHWDVGALSGLVIAGSIAAGVAIRRRTTRRPSEPEPFRD